MVQASSRFIASYLNVGLQHLWTPRDYRTFGYSSRCEIPGYRGAIELNDDEAANARGLLVLSETARARVQSWIEQLSDDTTHLERLAGQRDGAWADVNAAFALCALAEYRQAERVFTAVATTLKDSPGWRHDLSVECAQLALLTQQPTLFQAEVARRILRLAGPARTASPTGRLMGRRRPGQDPLTSHASVRGRRRHGPASQCSCLRTKDL